jgi:hypothetical protein
MERKNGHTPVVDPFSRSQLGLEAWTMVIGGENSCINALLTKSFDHLQYSRAWPTPKMADGRNNMQYSQVKKG